MHNRWQLCLEHPLTKRQLTNTKDIIIIFFFFNGGCHQTKRSCGSFNQQDRGGKAPDYQVLCFYNSGHLIWPNRKKYYLIAFSKWHFALTYQTFSNLAFCPAQLTLAIYHLPMVFHDKYKKKYERTQQGNPLHLHQHHHRQRLTKKNLLLIPKHPKRRLTKARGPKGWSTKEFCIIIRIIIFTRPKPARPSGQLTLRL